MTTTSEKEEYRTTVQVGMYRCYYPETFSSTGKTIIHDNDRRYFSGIVSKDGCKIYEGDIYNGFLVLDTRDELGAFCFRFVDPDGNIYSSKEVLEIGEIPKDGGGSFWSRQKLFNDACNLYNEKFSDEEDVIHAALGRVLAIKDEVLILMPIWNEKLQAGSPAMIYEGDVMYARAIHWKSAVPTNKESCDSIKRELYGKMWDFTAKSDELFNE